MSDFVVDPDYSLVYIDENDYIYTVVGLIDMNIDINFLMELVWDWT